MGICYSLCCETHKIAVDMDKQYGGGGKSIDDDKPYSKQEVDWLSVLESAGPNIMYKVREFLDSHSPRLYAENCKLFITNDMGDEPWEVERGWSVWIWDEWDDWHIENDAMRDKYWIDQCGYVWVNGQGYMHPKDMSVKQPLP